MAQNTDLVKLLTNENARLKSKLVSVKQDLVQCEKNLEEAEEDAQEWEKATIHNKEDFDKMQLLYEKSRARVKKLRERIKARREDNEKLSARLDKVVETNIGLKQENQQFKEKKWNANVNVLPKKKTVQNVPKMMYKYLRCLYQIC